MRKSRILVGGAGLAMAAGFLAAPLVGGLPHPRDVGAEEAADLLLQLARDAHASPNDASTRLRLALVLRDAGRFAESDYWLNEARRIDAHFVDEVINGARGGRDDGREGEGDERSGYPAAGPDVIVGDIYDLYRWGRAGTITAFSIGTISCNAGDTNLLWISSTNQHPVISQELFRYKDGRFEMIGQSWVKHGFYALTGNLCQSQFGYGCNGVGGSVLGVGCSDPYSAYLNGSYTYLGPKHEVNAHTGSFSYPYGSYPNSSPIGKRLQVEDADIKPSLNPGAIYIAQTVYVAADDAAAGNQHNNASYRRVQVTETQPNLFNLSFVPGHPTVREQSAMYAWQAIDPQVTLVVADVPDEGRFILGYTVTDNGDGTWNYEYAVQNLNSDRSARRFAVPVPNGVTVTNVGFHHVEWHSGAPYSNAPWAVAQKYGLLTWSTETYAQNVNANALRWATTYNFRFTADTPPEAAEVALGLFKPAPGVNEIVIDAAAPKAPMLLGDLNGDGYVNVQDLLILLGSWGACPPAPGSCPADLNDSGVVDVQDLLILLANWG